MNNMYVRFLSIINLVASLWWAFHGDYPLLTGNFMILAIASLLNHLVREFDNYNK